MTFDVAIDDTPAGAVIAVRVIPRASRTTIAGTRQHSLLVRVAAPPVEGAANDAIVEHLAEVLRVPARTVRIVGGAKSREKRVQVEGLSAAEVRARLSAG